MPYVTTRDLKLDVLHRVSEGASSPDYSVKAVDYLNRTYNTLCAGASEFLPEYVEDWWWLRAKGILTLAPVKSAGTVLVTEGNTSATLTNAPVDSVEGYRLVVDGHPESFEVLFHTAATFDLTLDSPYTGPTSAAASYKLMKVTYDLDSEVQALISPMFGYRGETKIIGISPERMDEDYPIPNLQTGTPQAFALESEQRIRFSHGGRTDGMSQRVEYRYRPLVAPLTDSDSSIPLIPLQWRHILSDMAVTYLFLDKNDDRSNAIALAARTGLAGMLKENRRRLSKMGGSTMGLIRPRGGGRYNWRQGPLRTQNGLIIG